MNNNLILVGYRSISYTSKKTGRPVNGFEVHYSYLIPVYMKKGEAIGMLTDKVFVPYDIFNAWKEKGCAPGDEFVLYYDKNGRVIGIKDGD